MSKSDPTSHRSHRARRVLLVLLAVVVVAGVAAAATLAQRARQRASDEALGQDAPLETVALSPDSGTTGRFSAHVAYTSLAAPDGGEASADLTWDDAWFFQDPTAYNHELATACSVLSAVANAESAHYQAGSDAPAYAERAFEALGFTEVSTASYRYRSEVVGEALDFATSSDDVVAYSIGLKRVSSPDDGAEKLLVAVVIRGSYGSEWLSDFAVLTPTDLEVGETDHYGFMQACDDIREDLADVVSAHPDDEIALLVTGHSRGGATANLLASYADEMTLGLRGYASLDSIYAYTFATPAVTREETVGEELFDNIFNVMNPSDLVPRFPLASWGFARYGRDVWLPGVGDAAFDELYPAMCARFEQGVGAACPYDPNDRATVDALVAHLSEQLPEPEDLNTVGGVVSVVGDLATEVDVMRVLYGHYPSVYISWMQVTGEKDLRFAG